MRIFVAGATGAIGKQLVPQLVARGHKVVATSQHPEKLAGLRSLGAEPVLLDGLDALAVGEAVTRAEPDAIVHQMTALAQMNDLRRFDRGFARTNQLRTRGTDHLLAAAEVAHVGRLLAQSYTGWPNIRDGGAVKTETDPLDPHPPRQQTQSLDAIRYLEQAVLGAPLEGIVLRYGNFYGPGASEQMLELVRRRRLPIIGNGGGIWSWIHVADAAAATVAALEQGAPGVYNVVDDDPAPVADWLPYLAQVVGAKTPRRVPAWLGRIAAGEVGVSMMTRVRGSSNGKARRELAWAPSRASWRAGFAELATATTAESNPLPARSAA
jgi:2-alkyl-3-oxoalkanoate reductase